MKKTLQIILDVVAWIVLILAMLITLLVFTSSSNNGVPNILGTMFMSVKSDSMSPTFNQGDLILVKKVDDLYTLKEDDVITFYTIVDGSRIINTHRIIGINQAENSRSFTTRGDNNPIDDSLPAYASDILGKWTGIRLPKMGYFMDFLKTKTGFFVCVLIPIALFFIFELYKFISALIEAKQTKITDEDEEEIKRKAVEEYLAAQAAKKAEEEAAAGEQSAGAGGGADDTGGEPAAKAEDTGGEPAAKAEDTGGEPEVKAEPVAEQPEANAEPAAEQQEVKAENAGE